MATILRKSEQESGKSEKERGMTQEELAEKANIDPKSIIQIEAGKRKPKVPFVSLIILSNPRAKKISVVIITNPLGL